MSHYVILTKTEIEAIIKQHYKMRYSIYPTTSAVTYLAVVNSATATVSANFTSAQFEFDESSS